MKQTKEGRVIAAMLKENTGAHMLDSGGAYGRNFERNKARNFAKEMPGVLRVTHYTGKDGETHYELDATLSVYHWLLGRVSLTDSANALNRSLHNFNRRKQWQDDGWLAVVDAWMEEIEAEEPYCCGDWINTYNHESLLSQILQFKCFDHGGNTYAAVQIHGGCDARGGYTAPRIFQINDPCEMLDFNRAQIYGGTDKDGNTVTWETENGYRFNRYDAERGYGSGPELGDEGFTTDPDERGKGKIYVDADGLAYCPVSWDMLTLCGNEY